MIPEEKKNPFYEKLKTYQGKKVTVFLKSQKKELTGILESINFLTTNLILKGEDGTEYLIRDDYSYMQVKK